MSDERDPGTSAAPAHESAASAARLRADLLAAIFFVVLGAAILYASWTMPRLEARRIHPLTVPGLVPGLLSIALILCGGLLARRSLLAPATGGWTALRAALVSNAAKRVLALVAIVLIYTLGLVGLAPFWAASALFVFSFIVLFEVYLTPDPLPLMRSVPWALGVALVSGVVIHLAFERIFLVRLP